jgi:protein involved in polysaccharide export with SLBB domain
MKMKKIIMMMSLLFAVHIISSKDTNSQVLNPGDGIRVIFFNITEEISGDYFIQQNGAIQLPYLGLIPTAGRDFQDIKTNVMNKYDSLYRDPELTIQPLFRINILGEVRNPGYYVVTDVEKLSGIIALAGGETADADLDDIYLVRNNEEIEVGANGVFNIDGRDLQLESGDRIYVPRRWWVGARNTAVIVSGLAVLVTIVSLFVK